MKKNVAMLAAAALTGMLALTGCAQGGAAATAATAKTAATTTEAAAPAAEAAAPAAETAAPGATTVYLKQDEAETITVSASASMSVEPDMAEVNLGVVNEATTAEEVQAMNSEQIDRVVERLKELGVEEKSIQTTEFYIYPNYDYSQNTERIVGYTANTYLKVTDLPIDKAGSIITESVKAGINTVNCVRYFSSQYDENYEKALSQALANAHTKAQALAAAAGGELDPLPTIREGYQDIAYRYDNVSTATAEMAASEGDASVTLNPGSLDVAAQVTVTYKLYMPGEAAENAVG